MKRLIVGLLLALSCGKVTDYRNSVCELWTYKKYRFERQVICAKQGTGFLIASDTVLTCAHVVLFGSPSFLNQSPADSVVCIFASEPVGAVVVYINTARNIAKLHIPGYRGNPVRLRKPQLTYTSTQHFGSYLLVIGYPGGEWSAFPARAIEPDTSGDKVVALIDSHDPLGGASGSPILYKGYVIGILQEQGVGGYTHKRFIRFRLIQ